MHPVLTLIPGGKFETTLTTLRLAPPEVQCDHMTIQVDETLAEVCCLDCAALLNPIAILARYAEQETRLSALLKAVLQTKPCLHCLNPEAHIERDGYEDML